ncbi:MAG: hypothetical protein A3G33_02370 [Omnitrophica bacterium RIFCSPLOWO2_12_FULL_44_17]|uniref:histidine kinase n=1 Tax=Candidatus Danuiimicrobium aquiferis TaxID=1801832 RepID=A0A1G1L161_9BACT|nr:MAG: hypothetical protein A3B72_01950 [Omnitrophica bacterium RIFCSPHIGHO2_02_FULL_45_28]OGW90352.1 MAG: hypothetical protein A3E74_01420 [Omnitrophica bacterium RIFCSPHIGHO2_12_FULL_44_12]OGW98885.1 MAG: hypothetical protein A3G33_02370 [Omnitrophica bacterium RIFCSPLOWO2_12_FULL_44_17]OGX02011.1 MAG: hypothetical protein A3J12_11365 [Omnitrophica bacterium RIFCSPLOWO2_02_FULL_44_11]
MITFIIILLVAGACGFVLYLFMKRFKVLGERNLRTGLEKQYEAEVSDKEITARVAHVIKDLSVPLHKQVQAAQEISSLLEEEIAAKADVVRKEVTAKYEKVVVEKERAVQQVTQRYETANRNVKKLAREKKQTEAIVKSLADGVVVMNAKGEPLMMNPAAERLLGMKQGAGKEANLLQDQSEERVVSFLNNKDNEQGEVEIAVAGGTDETKRVLRSSRAVLQNENGETIGMVSVLTDVTKQKEIAALKDQFVANVSHELRTPLHCIKESVGLLLEKIVGEINSEQERVLTLAERNILRLTRLINDLLDFAKLEAGEMKLSLSTFPVMDLLTHIRDTFDPWAKSKGITITVFSPHEGLSIEADHDKLNQVITNLVGNSMKFTPEGGTITMKAEIVKRNNPQAPVMVRFAIQDTGPGIAKEDQAKIFEKFTQTKTATQIKMKGTGLGLAIAKEIVELHGGEIWVESEEEKGSSFLFTIPEKYASAVPAKPEES